MKLSRHPDQTPEIREQVDDLRVMENTIAQADSCDLKYMGQRAYNLSRGKAVYEQKLSRQQGGGRPPKTRPPKTRPPK